MRSFALLLVALGLALPGSVRACWDGYSVQTDDGIHFTGGDESWSPERAAELASWALRFHALLGADGTLESEFGWGEAAIGDRTFELRGEGTPDEVFRTLATALGITRSERRRLLAIEAHPYTVQLAASHDRARAEALASRLSEATLPMGFYEAGGFPADHPEAHVIEADVHGARVYRVVVGAFLDRAAAMRAAGEIAAVTGRPTALRPLP
jgi:hypothetical protein